MEGREELVVLSEDAINASQVVVVFFCLQLINFIRDGGPLRVIVSSDFCPCSVDITVYEVWGVGYEEVSA